ncbi:MAG: PilZ domain-containing protein [Myxococcota bacterium]
MGWLATRNEETWRKQRVVPLRMAPVEVQVMGRGTLDVLRARNVSTTGLGIFVPHGFEGFDLAEEVELVITLPSRKPFLAMGVIKHVTETDAETCHFGVEFTALAGSNRQALEQYVRSRLG